MTSNRSTLNQSKKELGQLFGKKNFKNLWRYALLGLMIFIEIGPTVKKLPLLSSDPVATIAYLGIQYLIIWFIWAKFLKPQK